MIMPHGLSNRFNGTPSQDEINTFCNAAKNGDVSSVVSYLDRYGDAIVNERDHLQDTALTWAAWTGQKDVVALLLERGAKIDGRGMHEKTALCWAAQGGKRDVVEYLLENGADPSLRDRDGNNAVTLARNGAHEDVASYIESWSDDRRRLAETQKQRAERERQESESRALANERIGKLKSKKPPKLKPPK